MIIFRETIRLKYIQYIVLVLVEKESSSYAFGKEANHNPEYSIS